MLATKEHILVSVEDQLRLESLDESSMKCRKRLRISSNDLNKSIRRSLFTRYALKPVCEPTFG